MNKIDTNNLPKHIGIIMDGNGRWAKTKGKLRLFGHKSGVKAVRETVEMSAQIGIKFLTLYAFSTENWSRPKSEVKSLMRLLISSINSETKTLLKNNIKLKSIGDTNLLPHDAKEQLNSSIEKTKNNNRMTLILALSYSGRWDIISAVKKIIKHKITSDKIDEQLFEQYLSTKNVPNPELLIRTSGEYRISNFLLWQSAYSEFYFTDTLWPDFRKSDLEKAIIDFQSRERRFGNTVEQKNQAC
tara:strand:- start:240 stop:968 length:729 start_codon:yes stop_codon:yes gene_type:complete